MADYRINSTRIKLKETTEGARGGQGVVVVGTLVPNEAFQGMSEAVENHPSDGYKELVPGEARETQPEGLKESLPGKMRKLVSERIEKLNHERDVAVKMLYWPHDDTEQSTTVFKSFVNELSLMACLYHPNIIEFLGFVEDMERGDAWIILPWEANGNVRDFLKGGEWDIPERVSLVQDTAKGLQYLHAHDPPICHGDLKSLNILVNSSYRAVITDFGSARFRRRVESETQTAGSSPVPIQDGIAQPASPKVRFNASSLELTLTGMGFSLRWTAPEILREEMQDLPSDMWAMGWICWEIVAGKIPFEGEDNEAVIITHTLKGQLPAIRKDTQLSHLLMLCALMSDCWLSQPAQRIDASTFRRKVMMLESEPPSPMNPENQKARSASLLHKLGRMYRGQEDLEKAESHYRSAMKLATETEDEEMLATALGDLGDLYWRKSEFREAESLYEQAQEIYTRTGDDLGTAMVLRGLGDTYRAQSKIEEAEKALNTAHEIHCRIGNDLGAANVLLLLGHTYRARSKNEEAEKAFSTSHEINSRIGNDLGAANA
ncbi:hypothetical protein FS837_005079, partial [Tulasnella sp. UAMH 9824]